MSLPNMRPTARTSSFPRVSGDEPVAKAGDLAETVVFPA